KVAICARTEPNVRTTIQELRAAGIDAVGMPCDVSDPADVDAFAAFTAKQRGPARVLVNNAGIGRFKPLSELSLEDWDATMAVNVRALFLTTRAVVARLEDAHGGSSHPLR